MGMQTYRQFTTVGEARMYRHENGTGGWIFVSAADNSATLFPPEMPPTAIFHHPLTRGLSGELLASA